MKILITGTQGSGKTTHAKILATRLGVPFVSASRLAREFGQGDSPEARQVMEDINQGVLINNQVMASLVKNRLSQPDCQNGYILDGYPRSLDQLQTYDPDVDLIININVSEEEAMSRLLHRGRSDDTPEAIKNRLEWSREETAKVLDYYRSLNKLDEVDGTPPVDQVSAELEAKIRGLGHG